MNYIQMVPLADYLKEMCPHSQAILTVHYTDWGFALLGNAYPASRGIGHVFTG
ncbi:MAG: hypothetical protein SOR57_01740 [Parabacteroides sp.]|nr:hypothetical protein [Parabacteroides sp.]